ncbi:MAG TPA: winged helix-turn-helix domain-containing protein [Acidobacteriota bacterium]|nr:winged helix-turn-helix domain-containing protein [Acidobacteriota bacterium]HNH81063.1 winged helix-turn-helix domain-containing protein [Acidobacteriota bacterium]
MYNQEKHLYAFGEFCLDVTQRVLKQEGRLIQLTPKAFDTLLILVENSGRVLVKEELMHQLWPDSFVEEVNLAFNISQLRKVLGDDFKNSRFIQTIPRRGYRFIAKVTEVVEEPPILPLEAPVQMRKVIESAQDSDIAIESCDVPTVSNETEISGDSASDLVSEQLHPVTTTAPAQVETILPNRLGWLSPRTAFLIGMIVIIGMPGGFLMWPRPSLPQPHSSARSIAVLPFKVLQPQGNDEYLSIGLTDVLITRLSNLQQLVVRPTRSVLPFASSSKEAAEVGKELQVETVLDGSIQQMGDQVRVTVRLIQVSNSQTVWAFQCDETCSDYFQLQDHISEQVTQALSYKLSDEEQRRLTKHYTENALAYQEYVKGRYYTLLFTKDGLETAIRYFNHAIELDPRYALAYAGLADAYCTGAGTFLPSNEALPKAKAMAEKALSLDTSLPEAYAALGHAKVHLWDRTAKQDLQKALELNPNLATTLMWFGEYYQTFNPPESIPILIKARELDPVLSPVRGLLSFSYGLNGQFDLAHREIQEALTRHPTDSQLFTLRALVYSYQKKYPQALAELDKIPPDVLMDFYRVYLLIRAGRKAEAQNLLARIVPHQKETPDSAYFMALMCVALNDKDQAFKWLEQAYQTHSVYLSYLQYDPELLPLRSDPRYDDLIRRVGLS